MRSSRSLAFTVAVAGAYAVALAGSARAQPPGAQGFAVERLYPSAAGAGWLVMDTLDMRGGLGGAIALTIGYANRPLRVSDGANQLDVVSAQASADVGAAATYRRWRFYLDLVTPIVSSGDSATVGGYAFTGPSLNPSSNPDVLSDARIGTDVRLVGAPGGRFRFGAGAQLLVPFGDRADYDTDGTVRGMIRALFAGDIGWFRYAAQLGVHIRPLDDSAVPGSPRGSELLFGFAAGGSVRLDASGAWIAVVGPELYGATAFRAFFAAASTPFEALVSARVETTHIGHANVRLKVGLGAALNHQLGAADARVVVGVELFGRHER